MATYPFDPTGKLASNKITDEQQIITSNNWRDYHFIVPKFAPYFADTIKVKFKALDGTIRYLVEGQDWYPSHEFISASRACATPIFGSISFLNTSLSGVVIIESYQTVGGIWVLDEVGITELLADRLHNPRITTWESIVDLPATFPVIDHEWDLVDMVGMKEVVGELSGIEEQLRMSGQQGLVDHIADKTNPHGVTQLQVGLGLVKNYDIAPVSEAQVGTSNSYYMTPMTVKSAIGSQVANNFNAHAINYNNPHQTTASQVGAYSKSESDILLATKLSTTGIASDTSHFDGMTSLDYKAWVLEGTAANAVKAYGLSLNELRLEIQGGASADSLMFAGRTWGDAVVEILGGTAASATRFGGKTATEYANYIWGGTTANSNQFAGYTYDQVLTAARDGTVANSLKLEDHTLEQVIGLTLRGKAADSYRFDGMTYAELKNDLLTSTASNAGTLQGKTVDDIVALSQAGTSANATKFNNLTYAEVIAAAQAGVDAVRFNGKTYSEAKTDILLGTAAGSDRLGGYTYAEVLANAQAGTAANATKFAGKTYAEAKADILTGKSADSALLNGYTYAQVLAAAQAGTAANATKFSNYTADEFKAWILSTGIGTADTANNALMLEGKTYNQVITAAQTNVNAVQFDGKTYAEAKADILTGKSADTTLFSGYTYAQVLAAARYGTAANATLFNNMSFADVTTSILAGTAANASKFSGLTSDDWNNNIRDLITNQAPYMGYQSYTSGEVNAESWIKIGDIKYPTTQTLEDNSTIADAQWIISGGGGLGATDDASYYMRISVRGDARLNAPSFSIRNLSNVDSNINFGYTLDAATESIPAKVNVWVKVKKNHTRIAVTDLTHGFTDSTYNGVITTNSAPVAVEPTGILYITSIEKYVTNIDLTASSETINTRIGTVETNLTTLTTEINQAFSDLATAFDELKASIAAA